MPYINATTRPLLWAVKQAGSVIETGLTHIGELTVTGLEIVSNADENAFLGSIAGSAANYRPLPTSGYLEAGDIYGYGGGLVIVRQSHNRTEHAPADIPALFTVYRVGGGVLDWIAGERVEVGTRRKYGGKEYVCLQAHQTQNDWTPPQVVTLWREVVVVPPESPWSAGVAYKGDNTVGAGKGDIVTYNGRRYRCLQSHTSIVTWTPSAVPALWFNLGVI